MVFNGEIYNYLELAAALEKRGRRIRSNSDSEVLLEAFSEYGVDCFSMLRGFWALAVIDHSSGSVRLSRDRLGKKPLYWFKTDGQFLFASEIKGLLATGLLNTSENSQAVDNWLSSRLRDVDDSTFFRGVSKVSAGSHGTVEEILDGRANRFWSIDKIERLRPSEISIEESVAELRSVLEDAVSIRLRSDLPIAVSLSGGLDSSAIIAYAKQVKPDIKAVTTHFPTMDETPFAKKVCEHLDIDLEVVHPNLTGIWDAIDDFQKIMEEPFHSPNLLVSKRNLEMLRERGFGVVLNGAVGDEVFAGYRTSFLPAQVDLIMSGRIREFLANHRCWTEGRASPRKLAGAVWRRLLAGRSSSSMLSEDAHAKLLRTLVPYWLSSGDKSDMAVPVEVRCPFVDHLVIEFGMRTPSAYLIRDGWHKWLLRKAVEPFLPSEVVWRREKMGYPFPVEEMISTMPDAVRSMIIKQGGQKIDQGLWHHISYVLWRNQFITAEASGSFIEGQQS
jgi:asparagine synthase (glutamine-hydrolysing)